MLNDKIIAALEARGFKRWTKGTMDRLYVNARELGLKLKYYNTGNVSDATFRGEQLSNSQGRRYKAAKTYIDVVTGEIVGEYDDLIEAAQELYDQAVAEAEKEE